MPQSISKVHQKVSTAVLECFRSNICYERLPQVVYAHIKPCIAVAFAGAMCRSVHRHAHMLFSCCIRLHESSVYKIVSNCICYIVCEADIDGR